MKSAEIREKFLAFFEKHDHLRLPSSSLIPHEDPTLLFNNAGMNQFKGVFLGIEKQKAKRAVTSQKCVRAGGKHNDLDNVGFTARHHTFFEMLGNFSFGDYFKKEAIFLAWEFLTEELKLNKEKLYVTAFHDDKEAEKIWLENVGVSKDHFKTFGEKDNFWRMGDTGPCGPCSEIFYDLGPELGTGPEDVLGGEGDRFVEIWNLVFMQYEEMPDGSKKPLSHPSIDTGMGLERISMVMQKTKSNYETDVFTKIIDVAAKETQTLYEPANTSKAKVTAGLRVMADHARATSFLIADGVLPSNEGRGYVLRRIIRRAVRFNKKLAPNLEPALSKVCNSVVDQFGEVYPELVERKNIILSQVKDEEEKFLETLENGEKLLDKEIHKIKKSGQKVLDGKTAFKLYDTFGFPIDLTAMILKEEEMTVDEGAFEQAVEKAKELSKANSSMDGKKLSIPDALKNSVSDLKPTVFLGYEQLEADAKILEVHKSESDPSVLLVIMDKTVFYAEGGGQVGDQGEILSSDYNLKVIDVKKLDKLFVHFCKAEGQGHQKKGSGPKAGDTVELKVDELKRAAVQRNHSATHLLHAALIHHLGEEVQQAGSLVDDNKLRFDFSHKGPVNALTLQKIEDEVNAQIRKGEEAKVKIMSIEEAKKSGAKALFGEKYDDEVRVLNLNSGYSVELCGGTHVQNTSDILHLKIVNETGVSSGVRRVEALTGFKAIKYLKEKTQCLETVIAKLKLSPRSDENDILGVFNNLADENKKLSLKLKKQNTTNMSEVEIQKKHLSFGEVDFILFQDKNLEAKDLRDASDKLRDKKLKEGFCILLGQPSDKGTPVVVTKTKNLNEIHAGNLLKEMTTKFGGNGGGRPDFAQGSFKELNDSNIKNIEKFIETL